MRSLYLALGLGLLGVLAHCGGMSSNADPGGGGGAGDDGGGATQDGAGPGQPTGPSGLPCAVDAVLASHCRSCHQSPPIAGSPMPLMTWTDLQAPAKSDPSKKVYELVGTRIHDDAKPMPQPPNARLSATDTATLDSWIAAGAPKSTESCSTSGNPDGGVTQPLDCTLGDGGAGADLHFKATAPWNMPQNQANQYTCYGVDVTSADPKHIVAFAPRVDNPKIVHHILVFQADSSYPTVPQPCSAGGSLQWRLVFGWAPGGQNMYLPKEAGFPISAGTTNHYVVQVHYNNINALAGQSDLSGVDACTSAPRKYEADVVAFGTDSFTIPANSTYDRTCTVQVPSQLAGKTMFAAMPHMHTLGTQINTKLTPLAGGADVDLGTVASWDFQSQYWLPVTATTQTNDTITTHCQWKNTTGAPVKFGENTEDEMCYSFTMYYPRVTTQPWSWQAPAYLSTCK